MIGKVDTMIDVAEKAILALEIAEFATLENQSEVKNYTVEIAEQFKLHHDDIDAEIQKYSNGWDISRLVKMDKDILNLRQLAEFCHYNFIPFLQSFDS